MTQRKNSIPNFKNRQEMAEFWDTHDFTDYKDEFQPVKLHVNLEKAKDENIVVRVQKPVKEKLERIAVNKGLTLSSLTRMWIMEKLQSS